MTSYLLTMLGYLLVVVAGFGTVALLAGRTRLRWMEYAALSWLVGGGVISLATWIFGLAISGLALRVTLTVLAVGLGVLGWRAWRGTKAEPGPREWPDFGLWVVLGALVGYAVWLAPRVAFGWDALMIWEAKSWLAFEHGGVLPDAFYADHVLFFSWQFYPLYLPYLQSWIYSWVGAPDQGALAAFPALFLASTALLLNATIRRVGGPRWLAAVSMAGLAGIPYAFSGPWGLFSGYADFPLAALFLAALWGTIWWQATREPAALRLLAAIAALLPWLKREGTYLWLAALLVPFALLARERRWRELARLALPGLTVIVSWNVYLVFRETVADPTFGKLTLAAARERLVPVVTTMAGEMGARDHWGCLWWLTAAALAVLAAMRRWVIVSILGGALFLPLSAAVAAYLCSTWPNFLAHVFLSFQRLVLQLAPVGLLAIALACPWRAATAPARPAEVR